MRRQLAYLTFGLLLSAHALNGQGTAFTYQGRLLESGSTASGTFDLQFSLFDSDSGGNLIGSGLTRESVAVTNGLCTVMLDFGAEAFGNGSRWLEISVRRGGGAEPYTPLEPRQPLTAAPRALSALTAASAAVATSVTPAGITTDSIADRAITTEKMAPGQVVTSVNGLRDDLVLEAGANIALSTNGNTLVVSSPTWSLRGNSGTSAGVEFIGTTDDRPLELRVNSRPALRLEPRTNGAALNLIAGHPGNSVAPGVWGATIGGGGASFGPGFEFVNHAAGTYATIGGGAANLIQAVVGTVSGGFSNVVSRGAVEGVVAGGSYNTIGDDALRATISGGFQNTIAANCHHSTIGGGWTNVIAGEASTVGGGIQNSIQTGASFSTVSGGAGNLVGASAFTSTISGGGLNRILDGSHRATVGGGRLNSIGPDAPFSTIAGGYSNSIATQATAATIPGGSSNSVAGAFGFAAGRRAQANEPGTFVWGDSTDVDFASQGANEFAVRATGGVRLVSAVDATGLPLAGVSLAPGSGSWSTLSDRRCKANFESVDPETILEKVADLPLQTWNYVSQDQTIRHLGPTAQDFRAAFALGESDRTIAGVDADGVALAAVQGLYRMIRGQAEELRARDVRIARLEEEIAGLKVLVEGRVEVVGPGEGRR